MTDWLDKQGNPITSEEFMRLKYDLVNGRVSDYGRIGEDEVGEARVSTVWLGIDHRGCGDGPPLIFETMIFGGEHDQFCARYSTEGRAVEGHARVVADLRAGREPWFIADE
jgi:hypothetical protein